MERRKVNRRRSITLSKKIEMLDRLQRGEKVTQVGRIYGINESTVRYIKKKEGAIRALVQHSDLRSTTYCSNPIMAHMERALYSWVCDQMDNNVRLSSRMIRDIAKQIYSLIAKSESTNSVVHNFRASKGWLTNFKERYGLYNLLLIPDNQNVEFVLDYGEMLQEYVDQNALEKMEMNDELNAEDNRLDNAATIQRQSSSKREIKKPKMMEQFLTYSDCSDDEDYAEMSDIGLSEEDGDDEIEVCVLDDEEQTAEIKDQWRASPIPDEVEIEEVRPNLQVFIDTDFRSGCQPIKEEQLEENPFIGTASEQYAIVDTGINSTNPSSVHEPECDIKCPNMGPRGKRLTKIGKLNRATRYRDFQEARRRKLKRKSPVWKYFRRCGYEMAVCNYCSAQFKTPRGSTSTLGRHLLTHVNHKKGETGFSYLNRISNSKVQKFVTKKESLGNSAPPSFCQTEVTNDNRRTSLRSSLTSDRSKIITEKIASMIIKGYQPYSLVQDVGFRDLIQELDPNYQIPSKSYFSDTLIPDLYKKIISEKRTVCSAMIRSAKSCSLTVDRWSSIDGIFHLSINSHHMTEDFKIVRQFLNDSSFPRTPSERETFQLLQSTLKEWGIDDSEVQIQVVTDSSRDLAVAASKRPWSFVQCFAESLELAVMDAKSYSPGYSDVVRKARDIAWLYTRSGSECIEELSDRGMSGEEIVRDEGWRHEYQFLRRLLEHKEPIRLKMKAEVDFDWELLEEIISILKPIDEAMSESSCEVYQPLSMAIPIIYGIEHMLIARIEEKGSSATLSSFTRNLLKGIRSRFPSYKTNRISLIAMVLDPRYKAVILSEPEMNLVAKLLADEIGGKLSINKGQNSTRVTSMKTTVNEEDVGVPSLWRTFERVSKDLQPVSEKKLAEYQVKQYLDEPVVSRRSDPQLWWLENKERYDLVCPLARKYGCIPAARVKGGTKDDPSRGANTEDRRRYLIGPNIDQLVFLHENS